MHNCFFLKFAWFLGDFRSLWSKFSLSLVKNTASECPRVLENYIFFQKFLKHFPKTSQTNYYTLDATLDSATWIFLKTSIFLAKITYFYKKIELRRIFYGPRIFWGSQKNFSELQMCWSFHKKNFMSIG